jgi:hypothetical protein
LNETSFLLSGLFGVLNYAAVGQPINLFLGSHEILRSAIWVPFLFGFAGFAMSTILFVLDRILPSEQTDILNPSWSKVLYGISFFSAQYYLSGLLDYSGVDVTLIHLILAATAIVGFALFDTSIAGILLGVATAIAGPVAEIVLINVPHLYTYKHADIAGICSWISWVYLLGAPAVGNLSRKLYSEFSTHQ